MVRSLKSRAPAPPSGSPGALPQAPLGGTRTEAFRRLRLGAIGVVAVLVLIGLASIIKERATQTDSTAVAGAAPTSAPEVASSRTDPLAEAGVVPDMPDSSSGPAPSPTATASPGPIAR